MGFGFGREREERERGEREARERGERERRERERETRGYEPLDLHNQQIHQAVLGGRDQVFMLTRA